MKTDRRGFLKTLSGAAAGIVGGLGFAKAQQMPRPDLPQPEERQHDHALTAHEGYLHRDIAYVGGDARRGVTYWFHPGGTVKLDGDYFPLGSFVTIDAGVLRLCDDLNDVPFGLVEDVRYAQDWTMVGVVQAG